jgi:arginine repressor
MDTVYLISHRESVNIPHETASPPALECGMLLPERRNGMANKRERQSAILEIVNSRLVSSQEDLRKLLLHRGWDVTQATLSRDLRELRLARVPTPEGARYAVTDGTIEESRVALETCCRSYFSESMASAT